MVNVIGYKTNLDEVVRDSNYKVIPQRDIILFNLAKIRYEEDYLKEILPRIMNGTIESSLKKLEDGSFRETRLLGGGLIIYDRYDDLGWKHRDGIEFVEKEEQIEIFDKQKKVNLGFYGLLKRILDRGEVADWINMNKYEGYGTINGVIEEYTKEFRRRNKRKKNYNIEKYSRVSKGINKRTNAIDWLISSKEERDRLNHEVENLKLIQNNLLGNFKKQMDIYINDAADMRIPHMKLKSAFAAAMHANSENCFVYHISQTPKPMAYLGGIIEFGKLGVARKIRFSLDIDGQIADISKSCKKNFILQNSNGLYIVLEKYKFGPIKQKDGSEIEKVYLADNYLVEPTLLEKLVENKIQRKEKPKRRFWSFGRK